MIQAIMTAPGKIEFIHTAVPVPRADQVLIRVVRIGICGSDIHVYHGKHPFTTYPVVQGHEVSGEIIQTGEEVKGLQAGDKVTIQPQVVCGTCYPCRHGNYNICDALKVMGFQTTGAASEYFTIAAEKVLKLPDAMSFDEGALIEPAAVAVHALSRCGDVKGKKILVLGAGPIGNLVAQAAGGMGAAAVMITDLSEYRLRIARECGIEYCINSETEEIGNAIAKYFGPDKADVILECAGANATISQAISHARKGSDIIVVSVFADKAAIDLGLVQDRELRIIGTLMYRQADYEKAIELFKNHKIQWEPLITIHFPFKEYLDAYEFIEQKKELVMKVMIEMDV